MKSKKNIVIVLIIIVLYLVLAIVLFGWENFKNKIQGMSIMLSTGEKWQLKDGSWSEIENNNDYNWKKFDIYVDNQLFGKYDLLYNNKWYIYDKNRQSLKYDGKILAIRGNKKYEVIDFREETFDSTDEKLLENILLEKNVDYSKDFTYAKKVSLDIDGDNTKEHIYTVSNAFSDDTTSNERFSIVFINDEDVQVLYQRYADIENQYDLCVPKVNSILDVNKDLKYEIIFECNYYSVMGVCSSLYEEKDGIYKLSISKGC